MVSETLCPPEEERDRNIASMEAYENCDDDDGSPGGGRGEVIANDDPRGEYTYGEFPLESFDLLVDRALDFVQQEEEGPIIEGSNHDTATASKNHRTMVDLGSGCGRLVFYAALTRGGGEEVEPSSKSTTEPTTKLWNVHGIEIGMRLHSLAVNSLQRGIQRGWFESADISRSEKDESSNGSSPIIAFHNGNALLMDDPYYAHTQEDQNSSQHSAIRSLLSETDLLFAYSTVWETNPARPFDPELGAMMLSPKWSETLASLCPDGCVAVTTDRALDPENGWRLLDRMDVENPSVWGSVGYISKLEKK